MPSQYPYHKTVRNEYLGVSKVVKAMTPAELDWLAGAQLAKWQDQETRKRQIAEREAERAAARLESEGLKARAEQDTTAARQRVEAFRTILRGSLHLRLALDWNQLLDRRPSPPFQFDRPRPDKDKIRSALLGPAPELAVVLEPVAERPSPFEFFLPFLRTRRLARQARDRRLAEGRERQARAEYARALKEYRSREGEVVAAYNARAREYNEALAREKERYGREKADFLAKQEAHNLAVASFRSRYEKGAAQGVERYVQMAVERSPYPDGVPGDPEVQFDEPSKTLVLTFWLPSPADVPGVEEYKYVASRKAVKPVEMKRKDFEDFYDDVLHQIALRGIREVFSADHAARVEAVVFNGWVRGVDPKTGKPFTSCVLSCEAPRNKFLALDLSRVSPKECVRGLKGITAGPLVLLAPVQPIMDLNRDDDRFVQAKQVLDGLRREDNLAGMEWEDFEHLVRELFEMEFAKSGGEVRVTQASRDRGVDAVAFDPDPIRGGKFVIQAKRYNMVVPVSAVRDLYGTMIAEGATKGILVTTSHFGRESREFAKDKPITLIDGENLVYMFQKHGRDLHIALLPKGDPRRGIG